MTQTKSKVIGKSTPLIHSWDKVTGAAKFTDDLKIQNPLIIKIMRSPFASANIKNINFKEAQKLKGVKGLIIGTDLPNTFGVLPISKDEPAMAIDRVRYVGEPVLAIAAESEEIANEAISLVEIEYEITEAVVKTKDAFKKTNNPIHPERKKENNLHKNVLQHFGDIDRGMEESEIVIEEDFHFPSINHGFTEPHATQVEIDGQDNITIHSATQVPHYLHRALSMVLEIPMHRIRAR